MVTKSAKSKYIYQQLADDLERKIESGIFSLSEKLPSLRTLRTQTGYGMATVFQAYVELEKRGIIEAKHRSGYYIKPKQADWTTVPKMNIHHIKPVRVTMDRLIYELTEDMANPDVLRFGGIAISPDLMPVKELNRHMKSIANNHFKQMIVSYSSPYGLESLRVQIVKNLINFKEGYTPDDLLITNGCTEAMAMCLRAVTKPGDNIIIETPTDPWMRQLIKDLNLYTLELPTSPSTGIDIKSVEKTIKKNKVKAVLLHPNFQNPLGFVMPDENKSYIVELLEKNKIPIIENDIYGELFFGTTRPKPLKYWDKTGNVLYCSSFSKCLAAGLRVGWTMPGIYYENIKRQKLNLSVTSPTINQIIIAEYLKSGSFERHLRRLRTALKSQVYQASLAIMKYFPDDIKMTAPTGGFFIWIELPKQVNGIKIYQQVREAGISILPGALCSNIEHYQHFIRICCGNLWSETYENGIKTISNIIKQQSD